MTAISMAVPVLRQDAPVLLGILAVLLLAVMA